MDKRQKKLKGRVVSNKMNKTGVALVDRTVKEARTGKQRVVNQKYKFHDEENICTIGDIVEIGEVRPISKDKSWALISVIKKAIEVSE